MDTLFHILDERRKDGKDSMLVTVVKGSGSIPRNAGAYMIVGQEGRIYGTIGGGNLEYQSIVKGQKLIETKQNHLQTYDLGPNKAATLGMVCGGTATVLFYYVGQSKEAKKFLEDGTCAATKKHPYWFLLPLRDGNAMILEDISAKGQKLILDYEGKEYYAEKFCYDGKVYIFGGGHLAQELVPVLDHIGFSCIVADDRKEFVSKELFPQAERTILIDFAKIEDFIQANEEDYIVVVTRGHLCDTDAERFALSTPASYIGVVGSKRKTKFVREKLLQEGYSEEELSRVTAPIGLPIDSETPAEIAISIAAQLIWFRANKYKDH